MRRTLLIAGIAVVLAAGACALWVENYLHSPLQIPQNGYRFEIPAGTSLAAVAGQLAADGVVRWPEVLTGYGRITGRAGRIRAGEYELRSGITPRALLDELVAGHVLLHGLTLVEGWSVADIMRAIREHPALTKTLKTDDPGALAAELKLEFSSAEGAFLPETYRFPRGTSDRELLMQAHEALRERLAEAWAGRNPDLPLASAYELLILASIVERETALARERPLVAGVFARRLRLGMRLQTDPTVIYGLGARFDGNLTRRDLETDTPWNTYTRAGLPPTPIAAAGADAIAAAAQPAAGGALFFVATGAGDGGHRFSNTLEEHEAAVRDYLAAINQRQAR